VNAGRLTELCYRDPAVPKPECRLNPAEERGGIRQLVSEIEPRSLGDAPSKGRPGILSEERSQREKDQAGRDKSHW